METPEQNEICSKLTIKTPEQRNRHRSGVVIVNFEQISQIALVFLLLLWPFICLLNMEFCKDLFLHIIGIFFDLIAQQVNFVRVSKKMWC